MFAAELIAEQQHEERRHYERDQDKTIAREIAEIFPHERGHLGRQQCQHVGRRCPSGNRAGSGTRWGGGLAKFLTAILGRESLPEQYAEKQRIEKEPHSA